MAKKTEKDERLCCIYARFSSHNQNEESIEQQVAACKQYAAQNGLVVCATYADKAITGTTDARPSFQKMIADSSKSEWGTVLVWKVDRFGRDRYDIAVYKHKLKKNGVRVLYVKEQVPDGASGILYESILEGSAEYYSANLSQNVKRGHEYGAQQGKLQNKPPFGYTRGLDGKPVINETQAESVRFIFSEYLAGKSCPEIAGTLNTRGVKSAFGREFCSESIHSILKNEAYCGVFHCSGVRIDGGFPPIVSRQTFELVQAKRRPAVAPRIQASGNKYPLTGKIYCGVCGSRLTGRSGRYYACASKTRSQGGCGAPMVRKDWIEPLVAGAISRYVLQPEVIDAMADYAVQYCKPEESAAVLEGMRARQAELKKGISNLVKVIEAGQWSPAISARLNDLETESAKVAAAIRQEEAVLGSLDREDLVFFLNSFTGADLTDPAMVEALLNTFVQKVTVYPGDRLEIVLSYFESPAPLIVSEGGAIQLESGPAGGLHKDKSVWTEFHYATAGTEAVITFIGPALLLALSGIDPGKRGPGGRQPFVRLDK